MEQDKVTLERIKLAHPLIKDDLYAIQKELDSRLNKRVRVRFAQLLRTWSEQDALYAQGRTKPGDIVTYSKGGQSWHNFGLAVDIAFLLDKNGDGVYEEASWDFFKDWDQDGMLDFEEVDFVFKMYGFTGLYKADGKRWDFPHFQKTFGLTTSEAQKRHMAGDFIPGTSYIRI